MGLSPAPYMFEKFGIFDKCTIIAFIFRQFHQILGPITVHPSVQLSSIACQWTVCKALRYSLSFCKFIVTIYYSNCVGTVCRPLMQYDVLCSFCRMCIINVYSDVHLMYV